MTTIERFVIIPVSTIEEFVIMNSTPPGRIDYTDAQFEETISENPLNEAICDRLICYICHQKPLSNSSEGVRCASNVGFFFLCNNCFENHRSFLISSPCCTHWCTPGSLANAPFFTISLEGQKKYVCGYISQKDECDHVNCINENVANGTIVVKNGGNMLQCSVCREDKYYVRNDHEYLRHLNDSSNSNDSDQDNFIFDNIAINAFDAHELDNDSLQK